MITVTIYRDKARGWRWRCTRGGRIIADGSESYTRRADALRAWRRFADAMGQGRWTMRD